MTACGRIADGHDWPLETCLGRPGRFTRPKLDKCVALPAAQRSQFPGPEYQINQQSALNRPAPHVIHGDTV